MKTLPKSSHPITVLTAIAITVMLLSRTIAELGADSAIRTNAAKVYTNGELVYTYANGEPIHPGQTVVYSNGVLISFVKAEFLCTNKMQASTYFKNPSNQFSRSWTGEMLKPHLKRGMNTNEVVELLGEPYSTGIIDGKLNWSYATGWSERGINFSLDASNRVDVIEP